MLGYNGMGHDGQILGDKTPVAKVVHGWILSTQNGELDGLSEETKACGVEFKRYKVDQGCCETVHPNPKDQEIYRHIR